VFNLADFFLNRYATLSDQMDREDRQPQARHVRISMFWSVAPVLAGAALCCR